VVAGVVGAACACPADVVKSRMMNQPYDSLGRGRHYKSSWECLARTVADEGLLALYKGFFPCWIRLGPWTLVFWLVNERPREMAGERGF